MCPRCPLLLLYPSINQGESTDNTVMLSSDAQQKMSSSTFVHRMKHWSVTPDERPWLLFLNHRKQAINRTGDLYRALSAFQMMTVGWFPLCSSKAFELKGPSNSFPVLTSLESENSLIQRHSKSSNTGFSCQSQPASRCCYFEGSGWC